MSAESPQICAGRVVIITGAGRGIGRAHALEFARQGAKVVVNDLGVAPDGSDPTETPAQQVVDEIRTLGGEAVASAHDVSGWDSAKEMIDLAIDHFGGLDVVVNNAGIVRDRMFVNSEEAEWDAVLKVHVLGHAAPARHAAAYWRAQSKAGNTDRPSTKGTVGTPPRLVRWYRTCLAQRARQCRCTEPELLTAVRVAPKNLVALCG